VKKAERTPFGGKDKPEPPHHGRGPAGLPSKKRRTGNALPQRPLRRVTASPRWGPVFAAPERGEGRGGHGADALRRPRLPRSLRRTPALRASWKSLLFGG